MDFTENGFALVSNSNHSIYKKGSYYYKVADGEAVSRIAIQNEAVVMEALRIPHILKEDGVLITPTLGEKLPFAAGAPTLKFCEEIVAKAKVVHNTEGYINLVEVSREEILLKRMKHISSSKLLLDLYKVVEPTVELLLAYDVSFLPKKKLVHGDLHFGNILQSEGRPVLIDYESAHYSVPEWDWATLWISAKLLGYPARIAEIFAREVENEEFFTKALYMKLSSSLLWSVWKGVDILTRVNGG